ncbi:MAG: hypothetical protein E6J91_29925 [Deltaproteobacteria bacterium]|nr:MAG: hypothetical protein E6J91_29925 [Deltaproteobacteria bacterium]
MPQRLSLRCEPFDRLEVCISEASCAPTGSSAKPGDQVRYLASYLRNPEVGANTIVVEHPYVDRHWLEEYAGYYATLLDPPRPKATRLHFFDASWTMDEFMAQLGLAIDRGDSNDIAKHYIGFSVIRPLAAAPLGRTVLRPYRRVAERCFAPAALTHRVHLAGLTIEVEGLPFQQQDQGVAACATTALWSALTKVIRTDGGRAPTPFAVTVAATDQHVQARAFPALGGLDLEQMASAIHAFGYQPHVFQRASEADDFVLSLKTYLRSGLPVIVRARVVDRDLHAFTLVGYRERSGEEDDAGDLEIKIGDQTKLRARGVKRWYSHDDRFGAYARLGFVDDEGEQRHTCLRLLPTEPGFEHLETPMVFCDAIVPLYPKLRLTAEELIAYAIDLSPTVRFLARDEVNLHVALQFILGGEYLSRLHKQAMDHDRIVQICTTLALSRYVGVISWYRGDHWALDAVYDTTDLRRGDVSRPPLLALVPLNPGWIAALEQIRSLRFGDGPLIA